MSGETLGQVSPSATANLPTSISLERVLVWCDDLNVVAEAFPALQTSSSRVLNGCKHQSLKYSNFQHTGGQFLHGNNTVADASL